MRERSGGGGKIRIVYVNGRYVPENEAVVSVFDRGFLFADGVYEVTAVVGGRLIDYEPHMQRLERSLKEIQMAWPCSKTALRQMHDELIQRNDLSQGWVYMQMTRGAADRDFKFPKGVAGTLIGFTQTKELIENPDAISGVKVITVPDVRWLRRDIKTVMLLAPVLGKQQAHLAGAFEAWMVEDGKVTEGTSSNAYIVRGGRVITRSLSNRILAGVTRRALLALANDHGVEIEERAFSTDEAYGADEAFLTSASNFVLPIVEIDGRPIGGGRPGRMARRLRSLFLDLVRVPQPS
jgi:D-alanine transaminase